jgi:hypothetical protein
VPTADGRGPEDLTLAAIGRGANAVSQIAGRFPSPKVNRKLIQKGGKIEFLVSDVACVFLHFLFQPLIVFL